jgi:hypothetical protein
MGNLPNSEQPSSLTSSSILDRMRLRPKEDIVSGKELKFLQEAHRRGGDDTFQREFFPHIWVAYQKYFPTELAKICRQNPDEKDLNDQQILDKYLPRNWDWTNVSQCVESKLALLEKLQTLISPPPASFS